MNNYHKLSAFVFLMLALFSNVTASERILASRTPSPEPKPARAFMIHLDDPVLFLSTSPEQALTLEEQILKKRKELTHSHREMTTSLCAALGMKEKTLQKKACNQMYGTHDNDKAWWIRKKLTKYNAPTNLPVTISNENIQTKEGLVPIQSANDQIIIYPCFYEKSRTIQKFLLKKTAYFLRSYQLGLQSIINQEKESLQKMPSNQCNPSLAQDFLNIQNDTQSEIIALKLLEKAVKNEDVNSLQDLAKILPDDQIAELVEQKLTSLQNATPKRIVGVKSQREE
jgi:hypothetical protein